MNKWIKNLTKNKKNFLKKVKEIEMINLDDNIDEDSDIDENDNDIDLENENDGYNNQ